MARIFLQDVVEELGSAHGALMPARSDAHADGSSAYSFAGHEAPWELQPVQPRGHPGNRALHWTCLKHPNQVRPCLPTVRRP